MKSTWIVVCSFVFLAITAVTGSVSVSAQTRAETDESAAQFVYDGISIESAYDFGAPVLPSGASLPYKIAGQIYYDQGAAQFKGIDHGGNAVALSVPNGVSPVASGGSETIERAQIGNNGSICAVNSESGDWISNTVTRVGTGQCTVTINSDSFESQPVCTCSAQGGTMGCVARLTAATTIDVRCYLGDTGALENCNVDIICMGERYTP